MTDSAQQRCGETDSIAEPRATGSIPEVTCGSTAATGRLAGDTLDALPGPDGRFTRPGFQPSSQGRPSGRNGGRPCERRLCERRLCERRPIADASPSPSASPQPDGPTGLVLTSPHRVHRRGGPRTHRAPVAATPGARRQKPPTGCCRRASTRSWPSARTRTPSRSTHRTFPRSRSPTRSPNRSPTPHVTDLPATGRGTARRALLHPWRPASASCRPSTRPTRFWPDPAARADTRFLASPDYVGQHSFPDVFRLPTDRPADAVAGVLTAFRRAPTCPRPVSRTPSRSASVRTAVPPAPSCPSCPAPPSAAGVSRSSWRRSPVTGRRPTTRHHRGLNRQARLPPARRTEGDVGWRDAAPGAGVTRATTERDLREALRARTGSGAAAGPARRDAERAVPPHRRGGTCPWPRPWGRPAASRPARSIDGDLAPHRRHH